MRAMSSTVKHINPPQDLLAGYRPPAGGFDGAVGADGAIRPHWKTFSESFGAMPPEEQFQRQERLRRLVAENGIAHDLFADPGSRQPWSIDLIPIVISSGDWKSLSAA